MDEHRNRRMLNRLYAPLAIVLIAVAAVVLLSLIFRVSVIRVENNTVYTDEQIVAASGLERGVNLLFVNNFSAVSSIYSSLPYVESVSLKRVMPNQIIIAVTGSEAVACVGFGADYWLINPNGKLLEKIDGKEAANFIRVEHMEPVMPVAGEQLKVSEEDSEKLDYLYELLNVFSSLGLSSRIDSIDLDDLADPVFVYEGRLTAYLKGTDDTERRVRLIESAVSQLASGDSGTLELDAGETTRVYFSPK